MNNQEINIKKEKLKMMQKEAEIMIEEAYRKGFSHGYSTAKNNPNLDEKINEWRYDNETKSIGAPGTFLDGKLLLDIELMDFKEYKDIYIYDLQETNM